MDVAIKINPTAAVLSHSNGTLPGPRRQTKSYSIDSILGDIVNKKSSSSPASSGSSDGTSSSCRSSSVGSLYSDSKNSSLNGLQNQHGKSLDPKYSKDFTFYFTIIYLHEI